jgi:hypothetical protein
LVIQYLLILKFYLKLINSFAQIEGWTSPFNMFSVLRVNRHHFCKLCVKQLNKKNNKTLLYFVESPVITQYDSKVLVADGDEAVLSCKAVGIPAPQINWYKGDRQVYIITVIICPLTKFNWNIEKIVQGKQLKIKK